MFGKETTSESGDFKAGYLNVHIFNPGALSLTLLEIMGAAADNN